MRRAVALAAGLLVLSVSGSAHAASFTCTASAARVLALGQVLEPVKVTAGATTCGTETKSLTDALAGLPSLLTSPVLVAGTQVDPATKRVVASGGIADLRIRSLPDLPVTLPTAAVSDAARSAIAAARTVEVDLTGVKALIPVLSLDPLLRTDYTLTLADILALGLNPLTATLADITNVNTANTLANITIAADNATKAAQNALRAAIPDKVLVDGAAGLDALLAALLPTAQLPTASLLEATGIAAQASGSCTTGAPAVTGASTVTGLKVLGEAVPGTEEVDRSLTLIAGAALDPSNVALPAIGLGLTGEQTALIAGIPAAQALLTTTVTGAQAAIQAALDALAAVPVLDPTLARVIVRPGVQTKTGDTVVQEGLRIAVSIAGQTIVQGILGEARVSGDGVDCDRPVVDSTDPDTAELGGGVVTVPGFSANIDTRTPEGALLACSDRRVVLVDVLERRGRVQLTGVADPAFAGEAVSVVFNATGKVVARATVDENGGFATTAPLPPARIRESNAARYTAVIDDERSSNLKLHRRLVVDSMTAQGRRVTIAGRVLPPLGKPREVITLTRRVSCTKDSVVKRFRPRRDGSFRITVTAPKRLGSAVYRMTTHVRFSETGSGTFKTYTLPRAVELSR